MTGKQEKQTVITDQIMHEVRRIRQSAASVSGVVTAIVDVRVNCDIVNAIVSVLIKEKVDLRKVSLATMKYLLAEAIRSSKQSEDVTRRKQTGCLH